MALERFESYFKPEVRRSGEGAIHDGDVRLMVAGDNRVEAMVKASPTAKVNLKAASIEDESFIADCSCSVSAKGIFCKHIWAVMVEAHKKSPDFFATKNAIEKSESLAEKPQAQKAKQSDYRKAVYQQQKLKQKEKRQELKSAQRSQKANSRHAVALTPDYPEQVAGAIQYFDQNGFPLGEPIDLEALRNAKKKLARLLHPDRGGSHEEFVELNAQTDAVLVFLGVKSETELELD